jgi:hypothetical protein
MGISRAVIAMAHFMLGAISMVIERIVVTRHPKLKERMCVRSFSSAAIIDRHAEQADGGAKQQKPADAARLVCQPAPAHSTAPRDVQQQQGW